LRGRFGCCPSGRRPGPPRTWSPLALWPATAPGCGRQRRRSCPGRCRSGRSGICWRRRNSARRIGVDPESAIRVGGREIRSSHTSGRDGIGARRKIQTSGWPENGSQPVRHVFETYVSITICARRRKFPRQISRQPLTIPNCAGILLKGSAEMNFPRRWNVSSASRHALPQHVRPLRMKECWRVSEQSPVLESSKNFRQAR